MPPFSPSKGAARLGSCGRVMLGARLRIAADTNEIQFKGRHIFMGYLNQAAKTREAFTPDGWLCSGDVGRIDNDGYLFITGRIKELLVTTGGENIAPVAIENLLKECPIISNAMVVGDQRHYLSCLITLKENVNSTTGKGMA